MIRVIFKIRTKLFQTSISKKLSYCIIKLSNEISFEHQINFEII